MWDTLVWDQSIASFTYDRSVQPSIQNASPIRYTLPYWAHVGCSTWARWLPCIACTQLGTDHFQIAETVVISPYWGLDQFKSNTWNPEQTQWSSGLLTPSLNSPTTPRISRTPIGFCLSTILMVRHYFDKCISTSVVSRSFSTSCAESKKESGQKCCTSAYQRNLYCPCVPMHQIVVIPDWILECKVWSAP